MHARHTHAREQQASTLALQAGHSAFQSIGLPVRFEAQHVYAAALRALNDLRRGHLGQHKLLMLEVRALQAPVRSTSQCMLVLHLVLGW